ncbi:MAG TPA: pyridoxamine 5'-phosphate oxidase family protein [Roseiflexaceae bacterium]|nr:pyridoxamine 5'-phosphate oxidase family protein [Roseiflexaceae bacterium]
MSTFEQTPLNRVRRLPKRGHYDRATIDPIVDAALICHVGFVQDGQPFVIPTLHARDGESILLHGASTSRMVQHLAAGEPACLTITHVDGIVLARSVFHHSINYRSAVLFGRAEVIESPEEKQEALARFTERLLPGRWEDARPPNAQELKATGVLRFTIESASAKIRTGPPGDDPEDADLPVWAGVLPLHTRFGTPLPDPEQPSDRPLPDYLRDYLQDA